MKLYGIVKWFDPNKGYGFVFLKLNGKVSLSGLSDDIEEESFCKVNREVLFDGREFFFHSSAIHQQQPEMLAIGSKSSQSSSTPYSQLLVKGSAVEIELELTHQNAINILTITPLLDKEEICFTTKNTSADSSTTCIINNIQSQSLAEQHTRQCLRQELSREVQALRHTIHQNEHFESCATLLLSFCERLPDDRRFIRGPVFDIISFLDTHAARRPMFLQDHGIQLVKLLQTLSRKQENLSKDTLKLTSGTATSNSYKFTAAAAHSSFLSKHKFDFSKDQRVCMLDMQMTILSCLGLSSSDTFHLSSSLNDEYMEDGIIGFESCSSVVGKAKVTAAFKEKMECVIQSRTRSIILVLDGVSGLGNKSGIYRTCDGLGIQEIWEIPPLCHRIQHRRSRNMNTVSKKAQQWLTIRRFNSGEECLYALQEAKIPIWCSSLHDTSAVPLGTSDISLPTPQVAIVMGSEAHGVSDLFCSHADQCVYLPMYGFMESLNVSIATALLLTRLLDMAGPEARGNLTVYDKERLRHQWTRLKEKPSFLE